jgi:hypothetical protein
MRSLNTPLKDGADCAATRPMEKMLHARSVPPLKNDAECTETKSIEKTLHAQPAVHLRMAQLCCFGLRIALWLGWHYRLM